MNFLPKTNYGKWSVALIVAVPILFLIGGYLASSLYQNVSAGDTILEDISTRPALALSMLVGMASGIAAFITGIVSIFRDKERAFLVFVSTILGALLILFLAGEIIFPH